ncbi:MAG: HD domain-containing protein [Lachnospiraceae bacterium]|nr:HD domain-containing protein [Lachnospiraceae bacterium]
MIRSREKLEYVKTVGAEVIASPEFQAAYQQPHHFKGTVGTHMINTAYYSYCLCKLLNRFGVKTKTDELIIACLCHDLGIVGNRHHKYTTGSECCMQHPVDSIPIAERLMGTLTPRQENTILMHMWPLAPSHPQYREGVILSLIDKYCSVLESSGLLKPAAVM